MYDEALTKLYIDGSIGIIPTDTVYGIVARAVDIRAVERLYKLKSRSSKPGTLIAASIEDLEKLGLKHRYLKAVEQYWPGPVSVVIPTSDPKLMYLTQHTFSIAVRIPSESQLQELLSSTGSLMTSSANPPGEKTATTIDDAKAYFKDSVDFYIDGGDISNRLPSTVIRIVDDAVEILRQGAVEVKAE